MCLIIESKELIAEEDITVWKYLIKRNEGYVTPYQRAKIKIGKIYKSSIEKKERMGVGEDGWMRGWVEIINKALHSFLNKEDAKEHYLDIWGGRGEWSVIVKCKIPKGATYYKGTFDDLESIASNKLKYVEIVEQI